MPYCSTPETYRNTETIANNLFFFGQWNPNECHCRPQCLKLLFTSSLESTTDRYKISKTRNKARARVYYKSLEFEFIREELGYGTIDLLCDIGGTLSLLMGASLLTCCELLEVAWFMLVKKCCRRFAATTHHNSSDHTDTDTDTDNELKETKESSEKKTVINNGTPIKKTQPTTKSSFLTLSPFRTTNKKAKKKLDCAKNKARISDKINSEQTQQLDNSLQCETELISSSGHIV